jgi:biopolymer transport protein ExbD
MAGSVSSGFSDEDDAVMSDINVTPLVDVTLVLLIVFMVEQSLQRAIPIPSAIERT